MAKKILIAMSGGVDSAVAAYLLQCQGNECSGAMMRLFDKSGAGALSDAEDAKSICQKLNIDFHVLDCRSEFKEMVIDRFIDVYENGGTPNPCVICNRYLKFDLFLEKANELGIDVMATGHYARIEKSNERYLLKKGVDAAKDQSYMLYSLSQHQLSRAVFPLGSMTKSEIRQIAEENGFVNARKKDSQDICFVPDGDYASVIKEFTGKAYPPGNFVNVSGDILGTHQGLINYTVGQRKGLGCAFGEKLYVKEKNTDSNEVILARNDELFSSSLDACDFNWIAFDKAPDTIRANVKIRYSASEAAATVTVTGENEVHIEFDSPQRAIAKGQAVVVYDGEYVLGGGTII